MQMSKAIGINVANIEFKRSTDVPYCAYFVDSEINTYADSKVVYSEKVVKLVLYHNKNDLESEKTIENYLALKSMLYEKENEWVSEQEILCTIYTLKFKGNEAL